MSTPKKETQLHSAAKKREVIKIRYLLYDKQCDPNTLNMHGKTATFMFFINLLTKANDCGSDDCLTNDEIACFRELLWFTYDTQRPMEQERREIFDMVDYCFQFCDVPLRKLCMEIVNVFFTPAHHRRYFVEKILRAGLPSDYCLIASMFDMNELLKDSNFVTLRSNFLNELFALFMADESFFEEYISEVMASGWTFNVKEQTYAFCVQLTRHHSIACVFSFIKYLIRYGIDFAKFLELCIFHLPAEQADAIAIDVFVPLSNFINAPIDLARILRQSKLKKSSYFNFNETESVLDDFNVFIERERKSFQVVSLKNLARMSVRKMFFRNHTHYKALALLYSQDIPVSLRTFLCYNYCNLEL